MRKIIDLTLEILWHPLWLRLKRICLQFRRPGFSPGVGKIPCRKEWLPTIVLMPGEFHGQSTLGGYSLWGLRVRHDSVTNKFHFHFEVLNVSRLESAMHQEKMVIKTKIRNSENMCAVYFCSLKDLPLTKSSQVSSLLRG